MKPLRIARAKFATAVLDGRILVLGISNIKLESILLLLTTKACFCRISHYSRYVIQVVIKNRIKCIDGLGISQ